MKKELVESIGRSIASLLLAVLATAVVAFHVGAPVAPYRAEAKISAFWEASSKNGGPVSAAERDSSLEDSGYFDSEEGAGEMALLRVAGLMNWFPKTFGVAMFLALVVVRPRGASRMLGIALVVAVSFLFGPYAGAASLTAALLYLIAEVLRLRSRASNGWRS